MACRYKVVGWLKKRFSTPAEADQFYFGRAPATPYGCDVATQTLSFTADGTQMALQMVQTQFSTGTAPVSMCVEETVPTESVSTLLNDHRYDDALEIVPKMSVKIALLKHGVHLPSDYLHMSLEAILQLKESERPNVLYDLAKGLGTLRADHSDVLFPRRRMPMGLLQYMTGFFLAEDKNQVRACTCVHMYMLTVYYPTLHVFTDLYRYLSVRMNIEFGCRHCMYTLARSGHVCIMGLCGMWFNVLKRNPKWS